MSIFMLVDGHVHFHRCFTWPAFLSAAAANFARARGALRLPAECPGCLMFTESAGANRFQALRRNAADLTSHGWAVAPRHDGSVSVTRGTDTVVIVPGRQIVTEERLEVLALGCPDAIADAQPIRQVLRSVVARGAVAVVPWGFGKWLGGRGRILRTLIEDGAAVPFCLGDNGGRAKGLPAPSLFTLANRHGIPVLGGSDPLPMPTQVTRPGSYGFVLDDISPGPQPVEGILDAIRSMRQSPPAFGNLSPVRTMVTSQLALRWRRLGIDREASA